MNGENARICSISSPNSSIAQRLAAGRGEHVDEPAAHGEVSALLDALDALVAGERQVLDESVDPRLVARRDPERRRTLRRGRDAFRQRHRGRADETSGSEHLERPQALADEMRRRLEAGAVADAAAREEADPFAAAEPCRALGRVACVGVLGEQHQQAASHLVVQRRQEQARAGSETRARAGSAAANSRSRSSARSRSTRL